MSYTSTVRLQRILYAGSVGYWHVSSSSLFSFNHSYSSRTFFKLFFFFIHTKFCQQIAFGLRVCVRKCANIQNELARKNAIYSMDYYYFYEIILGCFSFHASLFSEIVQCGCNSNTTTSGGSWIRFTCARSRCIFWHVDCYLSLSAFCHNK